MFVGSAASLAANIPLAAAIYPREPGKDETGLPRHMIWR
jgi:hypothetical protein